MYYVNTIDYKWHGLFDLQCHLTIFWFGLQLLETGNSGENLPSPFFRSLSCPEGELRYTNCPPYFDTWVWKHMVWGSQKMQNENLLMGPFWEIAFWKKSDFRWKSVAVKIFFRELIHLKMKSHDWNEASVTILMVWDICRCCMAMLTLNIVSLKVWHNGTQPWQHAQSSNHTFKNLKSASRVLLN